ncbi:MAG: NUDIX domain-containing protein [Alphaproteobacteria bacterium]|nr:NUDIX domain-containing protein [Alphaproteobacteria bacterium]
MPEATIVRKALVYLTQGHRLLVFSHPFHPEAGLQVPGGTIEEGEDPADAARRELTEETGLGGFALQGLLGQADYAWQARIDRRFVFHATIAVPVAKTWRHFEANGRP